jgi:hypothetical protein
VAFYAAVYGRGFDWGESSAGERLCGWFCVPLCAGWDVFTGWWLVEAQR